MTLREELEKKLSKAGYKLTSAGLWTRPTKLQAELVEWASKEVTFVNACEEIGLDATEALMQPHR